MVNVYERIEEARKLKRITKVELAKHLGISAMGYHHMATGRTPINTDRLQIISRVLGVPAGDFLRSELTGSFTDNL